MFLFIFYENSNQFIIGSIEDEITIWLWNIYLD